MIRPGADPIRVNDIPDRPGSANRILAAVAFIDVVGYSILMATDEARTHSRWMGILDQIIRPKTRQHHGEMVKLTGDGALVRFASVLEAVEWALDVQQTMLPEAVTEDAGGSTIALRIAVHIGDVILTDGDIYGDGVNVAARLQEHAKPGGIALSEAVYDLVRGTVGGRAIDLGMHMLKNFEKPVRIYSLEPAAPVLHAPAVRREAPLPSIAVLPFLNIGPEGAEDYFGVGIVEDIIVSLAGIGELFVISSGSTNCFRGQRSDPREVGRTLGVRYVLAGTIRMSPRLIRVATQLFDSETGGSIWNETMEVAPGELFEMQDQIVRRVITGIAPNVRAAEMRRAMRKRPENFTAYDYTLRARHVINSLDSATYGTARDLLNKAMETDPYFALPFAWAAWWHLVNVGQGWSTDIVEDLTNAANMASRAIELDQQNALALAIYGHCKSFLFHQYDMASIYLEQALIAGPNTALAWVLSGATLAYTGNGEKAVAHVRHGVLLSPLDPLVYFSHNVLGIAYYASGEFDEAVKWCELSRHENPAFTANHRVLIASLVAVGRLEDAREVTADLMQRDPGFRLSVWERTLQPYQDPKIKALYIQHMRMSGLPE